MAALSGIEAIAAPANAHNERGERAAVDFGGAVTHRDLVREKLRVDPAALADKMRAAARARDAPKDEDKGRYVDVTV